MLDTILKHTTIRTKKTLMYYISAMNFMFVYSVLAYSIAVFLINRFPENPNAIFLVGIILGLASFSSFFFGSVWAYLQNIFPKRKLLLTAVLGLFITVSIFFGTHFLSPLGSVMFTLFAALFYGGSYDLYETTMSNIILEQSPENEHSQGFSQKKTAEGLGMILGLGVGGMFLSFGSMMAQFFLLVFLTVLFFFLKSHFEKEEDNVALQFSQNSGVQWKEILASVQNPEIVEQKLHNAKKDLQQMVLKISKATQSELQKIPETAQNASEKSKKILNEARLFLIDVLAKENEVVRAVVPQKTVYLKNMWAETKQHFSIFSKVFSFSSPFALKWAAMIVMFFSFWDTMIITFQPIFLQRFNENVGEFFAPLLVFVFILPVLFTQIPFSRLSEKIGSHIMIIIGVFLSSFSLLLLGFLDLVFAGSMWIFFLAGIGNALGYAAAFSPAQAKLAHDLEILISENEEKNSTITAVLRIILNLGNVIGQMIGGLFFSLIGFLNTFLFFAVFLLCISVLSLLFFSKLVIDGEEKVQE